MDEQTKLMTRPSSCFTVIVKSICIRDKIRIMDKFEALYVINKSAKKYQSRTGKKNQTRSDALYCLKHRLINEWIDDFKAVEEHIISGRNYYCVYTEYFCYHIPEENLNHNIQNVETKTIKDFDPRVTNEIGYTEKQALNFIDKNFGINPNRFISDMDKESIWGYISTTGLSH